MKFKIDERLPIEAAELLRQAGYDTATVLGQDLGGAGDPDIAVTCQRENRAFITLDLDFAGIRVHPPEQFPGLIVLRSSSKTSPMYSRRSIA
jgi:predicted nuclease of predicted toxin-antitoxin system